VTRPLAWRLVSWRFRRHLPEETRQAILGDLLEDYRRDRRAHGRPAAERRFLSEAWSVAQAYRRAADQDQPYSARASGQLAAVIRDGIFAARAADRDRTTTAALVLTIGLALAANTALFSIFDGLLFRPRTITAEDATSAPFTLVLGYDVRQTRFGGDPSIVGRHVEIQARRMTPLF
jgi:hypothetical protein